MKTLFLCRHAKSDWTTDLPDHERPLNDRGLKSAPIMAGVWKELAPIPKNWVSSSAKRALQTAQMMASEMPESTTLAVEHKLYHAEVPDWLQVINALPNDQDSTAMFGHNPGITQLVNDLTGSDISNIPTCGLVKITFTFDEWKLISKGTGTLDWFKYPKKHAPQ